MTPELYQRMYEVFTRVNSASPDQRPALLNELCGSEDELRHQVERLLAADTEALDLTSGPGERLRAELDSDRSTASGVALPPNGSALIGQRIGAFTITNLIGRGGMGAVYEAQQDSPRRRVALKMIRPEVMSRGLLLRFRFEAEVLGRLQHPGIAQIYDAGEVDTSAGRQPYFAMEFVEGVDLRRYAQGSNLSVRSRLELVARVCDAVHHAHQKGIVHRDLKPDNVLVVEQSAATAAGSAAEFAELGQPKVLDFGVARATDADIQFTTTQTDVGRLVGTLAYMSPEQVVGDTAGLDTRSDIYALGVILYELLSGRPPFDLRHKPIPEVSRVIREDEPTRLSSLCAVFRGDIDTIVGKALDKDRARRYQSAAELASDIRRYLANEPITAHPPTALYQLRKFARRNRGLVAGLALAFVTLIAGAFSSLLFGLQAHRGQKLAVQNEAVARRTTHRLSITAAAALGKEDPVRALNLLAGVPAEFRGWEWRHLNARYNAHVAEYLGDGPAGPASTLARRPDGTLLAALMKGDSIELVELGSGTVESTFHLPGGLTHPNLAANGSYLAALSPATSALYVWEVNTQTRVLTWPVASTTTICTYFSADGSHFAVGTKSDGITLLETATGRLCYESMPGLPQAVIAALSPTGSPIAFSAPPPRGLRGFTFHVISIDGEQRRGMSLVDGYNCVCYSPDGTILALGQNQRMIRLFDSATLEELRVLYGHAANPTALAFSPDGARLASAAGDGSIRIWDVTSGQVECVLAAFSPETQATSLLFGADGTCLAAGNSAGVRLWELNRGDATVLAGHSTYVYDVIFSPDPGPPRLLASASYKGEARLWDALTGALLAEVPSQDASSFLGFSRNGARLLVSNGRGLAGPREIAVLDTAAGVELLTPRSATDAILFETPFRRTAAAALGTACDVGGEDWSVTSLDGTRAARVLRSMEIQIIDPAGGTTISCIDKHDSELFSVVFSPDASRIAAGDRLGAVTVWDCATGTRLATMAGHRGRVFALDYSPDGTRIVSGADDGNVILWDAQAFEQALVLRGHANYVHSVHFSPDGTMLASGSGDETIRLWDSVLPVERRRQLKQIQALRREAEPLVDRLLVELGDPLDVADRLRQDASLSEPLRSQALTTLLYRQRTTARDD